VATDILIGFVDALCVVQDEHGECLLGGLEC
jgi:hypothetical protein